jgi:arylsulfatase A-like enzyme
MVVGNLFRGLGAGLVAGGIWWTVETTVGWLAGGFVPGRTLATIAALDCLVGAVAGAVIRVALGLRGRPVGTATLALALVATHGFLRVYQPPGFGSEAVFGAAWVVGGALALWLVGRERAANAGPLAFVHLLVLGTTALAVGGTMLDAESADLRGVRLGLVVAALPLAAVVADALLGLALRRPARLAVELAAAAVAGFVWGHPLSTAALVSPVVTAVPPPAGTPDVILVSLDTTRADHLSTYGYARETSPALTAFAADALLFTQGRSPAAWTLPGHASVFTGQYPSRHGAHLAGAWLSGESIDGRRQVAFPLAKEAVTLTEALRDRGYATGAFVANFSYLYRDWGLAQGFGRYEDAPGLLLRQVPHVVRFAQRFRPGFCLKPYRSADEINAAALKWLDQAPKGRPAFVFLNYMEPHQPWLAEPPYDIWSRELPYARRLSEKNLYTHAIKHLTDEEQTFIQANYDGQVRQMDDAFGELIAGLKARGRYENALIVVFSDHGELLGEHGHMGHIGRMLYEPLLHVPLIVKEPGAERRRGRDDRLVQLVDVLPTILHAAGAPLPANVQGERLPDVTHPSIAEEDVNPFLVARYGVAYDRGVRVLYDGSYKLITTTRGERMLFDLAADPGETNNLATVEPERTAALVRRLHEMLDVRAGIADAVAQNERWTD